MKKFLILIILSFTFGQFSFAQDNSETIYRATSTKDNDLVHTKLDVSFNFETSQLYGEEWLTATPHFYPMSTLELDAKAMDIQEVKVENKKAKYSYQDDKLTIDLGKTFQKGEEYQVYIKYVANPEKVTQGGSEAISDAKGLYFIDPKNTDPNKPTQVWTQGETESSSCWFPTIDKPNQKTSEEIYITVPNQYLTLSNGKLVSSKKNGNNRTDYWKFDQKHAPYLFFMGVGEFAEIKDKWRDIEVNYYVEEEYKDVAKDIFGLTPEMIEFFSNRLSYDYPWDKYSQIVCRDYVSGAMENTTAVIFGDFVQRKKGDLVDDNIAESIIAHELFHHWFGDLVTTESWSNLTVNESFANYSEYLWFEHKYGKERAEAHRFKEMQGYNNPENFNKDLVRFHYKQREDMFDRVSYNKGGLILHMLRNYLGDDAFFAGLTQYLKKNEYGTAEAHQLRLALEEVSGKDLNWFFNQWYFGNGHPKLKVSYDFGKSGKVGVTIEQTQEPLFEFPLAIDVYTNGKAERHNIWVKAEKSNNFTFDLKGKPQFVNVNADHVLLCDIEDSKDAAAYEFQYDNGKEFGDRLLALRQFKSTLESNPKAIDYLIKAINDKSPELQRMAISSIKNSDNEMYISKALKAIAALANNENADNIARGLAISTLGVSKEASKYESLYLQSANNISNSIKSASISALLETNPTAAEKIVANLPDDAYTPEIAIINLENIIANNDTSKMKYFVNDAPFFAFIAQQDEELGKKYQKAFMWITESDNAANMDIIKSISQVMEAYPQAKPVLTEIVNQAIEIKKAAVKANSKNTAHQEHLEAYQKLLN